jgi:hypothetical protein
MADAILRAGRLGVALRWGSGHAQPESSAASARYASTRRATLVCIAMPPCGALRRSVLPVKREKEEDGAPDLSHSMATGGGRVESARGSGRSGGEIGNERGQT